MEVWLRMTSCRHCYRSLEWLAQYVPPYRTQRGGYDAADRLAQIVDYANERFSLYPADCLTKSLVLHYHLKRLGWRPRLVFGVRTLTGQFQAHAWLELDGRPLQQLTNVREIYTPMDELPQSLGGSSK
ncbi:MAG: lasso peptide biosynthesis B2 protein [Pseudomonadota bacterium]